MKWQIGKVFIEVNMGAGMGSIKIIAPVDDYLMTAWQIKIESRDAVPVVVNSMFYAIGDKDAEKKALEGWMESA